MATELMAQETPSAVIVPMRNLSEIKKQRQELAQYISSELKDKIDYGVIPGCQLPSLWKPGAEKLLNLFGLGSKIADRQRETDAVSGAVICTYTMEVFHLATGRTIAQCEGSANSHERKWKSRPAMDMLNTLMKMAQKRALVGATILATHASDYFTQDIETEEDAEQLGIKKPPARDVKSTVSNPFKGNSGAFCKLCNTELLLSKSGLGYYCPNFKDVTQGEHTRFKVDELQTYKEEQGNEPSELGFAG